MMRIYKEVLAILCATCNLVLSCWHMPNGSFRKHRRTAGCNNSEIECWWVKLPVWYPISSQRKILGSEPLWILHNIRVPLSFSFADSTIWSDRCGVTGRSGIHVFNQCHSNMLFMNIKSSHHCWYKPLWLWFNSKCRIDTM